MHFGSTPRVKVHPRRFDGSTILEGLKKRALIRPILIQVVELALLCNVHWIIPLLSTLDNECLEKLFVVMSGGQNFFRVAASFNNLLQRTLAVVPIRKR